MYLPSHREILDRFRAGNAEAMSEVYRHYSRDVAGYIGGLVGARRTDAKGHLELVDLVQVVFTRAFEERARLRYDGVGPYLAYLKGIAHHTVIDHLRKQRSADRNEHRASTNDEAEQRPDQLAEENEAATLVARFRASLSKEEQRLYELRFLAQRSQEDAAAELALTRIQLRLAERRLRERLLAHLKQHGYLERFSFRGWRLTWAGGPTRRKQGQS